MIKHKESSLANSAGIALGSEFAFDLTRPGLSLYGGVPRDELKPHIQQVVSPKAALIQTRTIAAGDRVGYNATFTASKAMRIGVVSLGYADGILRSWNGAQFRHGQAALPVLGQRDRGDGNRICRNLALRVSGSHPRHSESDEDLQE